MSVRSFVTRRHALIALGVVAVLAAAFVGSASAAEVTLYDQTGGTPTGYVPSETVSQNGHCDDFPGFNECYAADDFTVPPGPGWYVDGVTALGAGGDGQIFWHVFPGGSVPGVSESLINDSPFGHYSVSSFTGLSRLGLTTPELEPAPGLALSPGHYWLEVYAPSGSWEWQARSPQAGSPAVWRDGGGGPGRICAGDQRFHALAECNRPGPDLRFSVLGEEMSGNFDAFQLGKSRRMPSGGVEFPQVKLPGPSFQPKGTAHPQLGFLSVRKLSGEGAVTSISPNSAWKRVAGRYVTGPLKIKPTAKTKALLKQGKALTLRLQVTYRRATLNEVPTPPRSQKLKIVLEKP